MNDFTQLTDQYFAQSLMTPARVIGTDDRDKVDLRDTITHLTQLGLDDHKQPGRPGRDKVPDSEKIIGKDGRLRKGALEAKLYPWVRICRISMRCPDENGLPSATHCIGSGWFAGPKTIITAGHVVYDTEWPKRTATTPAWGAAADIWIGYNQGMALGHALSTDFRVASAWRDYLGNNPDPDQKRFQTDLGCIQLSESLSDLPRFFDVGSPSDADLADAIATASGFPQDLDNSQIQYSGSGPITRLFPRAFYHEVDTFGGESGAPVWLGGKDVTQPLVVGIHTGGDDNEQRNWAVRITPEVKALIEQWVAENP